MRTASYEFLMKPKESAGCHQTFSRGWGLGMSLSAKGLVRTLRSEITLESRQLHVGIHVCNIAISHPRHKSGGSVDAEW